MSRSWYGQKLAAGAAHEQQRAARPHPFSPTDVLPMSRWAKMGMTVQAAVSIVTVALIVARAVNILR